MFKWGSNILNTKRHFSCFCKVQKISVFYNLKYSEGFRLQILFTSVDWRSFSEQFLETLFGCQYHLLPITRFANLLSGWYRFRLCIFGKNSYEEILDEKLPAKSSLAEVQRSHQTIQVLKIKFCSRVSKFDQRPLFSLKTAGTLWSC